MHGSQLLYCKYEILKFLLLDSDFGWLQAVAVLVSKETLAVPHCSCCVCLWLRMPFSLHPSSPKPTSSFNNASQIPMPLWDSSLQLVHHFQSASRGRVLWKGCVCVCFLHWQSLTSLGIKLSSYFMCLKASNALKKQGGRNASLSWSWRHNRDIQS